MANRPAAAQGIVAFSAPAERGNGASVSLRGRRIEERATLPDGREAVVRVGVPDDPYLPRRELGTVALELLVEDRLEATLSTVLAVEQESEALALAREVASGLSTGTVEPTAAALEPYADALR